MDEKKQSLFFLIGIQGAGSSIFFFRSAKKSVKSLSFKRSKKVWSRVFLFLMESYGAFIVNE